jgi:hypothetical protein
MQLCLCCALPLLTSPSPCPLLSQRWAQVVWVREGKALFLLRPDHPLRVWAWNMVRSDTFESFVLGLILANCVLLALDNPGVKEGSTLRQVGGDAPTGQLGGQPSPLHRVR